jgi:hypothetical protein
MSSDQAAFSSSSERDDLARFGYIDRDAFGRTTLYTTVAIHGDPTKRTFPTYFQEDADGVVFALSQIIDPLAVDAVAAIADDVDKPFAMLTGIWVSVSDNPDYKSMIVFFKKADSRIGIIARSIAKVLHPNSSATLIRPLERQAQLRF